MDTRDADIHAARGVALREFPLPGHGFADYLLYVDGKAAGVVEAKKAGITLTGVETQSAKYTKGLPPGLPAWAHPLPFSYQSTGVETHFTNGLDPEEFDRDVQTPDQILTVARFCCHRFAQQIDALRSLPRQTQRGEQQVTQH